MANVSAISSQRTRLFASPTGDDDSYVEVKELTSIGEIARAKNIINAPRIGSNIPRSLAGSPTASSLDLTGNWASDDPGQIMLLANQKVATNLHFRLSIEGELSSHAFEANVSAFNGPAPVADSPVGMTVTLAIATDVLPVATPATDFATD